MIRAYRGRAVTDAAFAPATLGAIVAAGFVSLGDIEAVGEAGRRERLPSLSAGQHHRVTAILAEARDDDVAHRCRHFGDPA